VLILSKAVSERGCKGCAAPYKQLCENTCYDYEHVLFTVKAVYNLYVQRLALNCSLSRLLEGHSQRSRHSTH